MPGGLALISMAQSLAWTPVQALAWTLVHSLWQGTLAALIYFSIRRLVRDPARRYTAGFACWFLFFTLQVFTFVHCYDWAKGKSVDMPLRLSIATDDAPLPSRALNDFGAYQFVDLPEESWMLKGARVVAPLVIWITGFWIVGSAIGILRYFVALKLLQRALALCRPLETDDVAAYRRFESQLQLHRNVEYVQTEQSSVPATFGWLWPVVLVPVARRLTLPRKYLDAMILHELAHIRRRDSLTHRLRRFLGTFYFYHPALLWMDAWMTEDSEEAADEIASRAVGDEQIYARALLSLEEARTATLLLGANGGSLKSRLLYVIASPHAKGKDVSSLSILMIGLCTMLILMFCGEAVGLASSPEQRTLAWVNERNLAEAALNTFGVDTATDHASPAIIAAVAEFDASGKVRRETLVALADALHKGVPPDLILRKFRHDACGRDKVRTRPVADFGSTQTRTAIVGLLTDAAAASHNPGAQAHLAQAAYTLLVLDFAVLGGVDSQVWIRKPANVEMLHLDPARQRQLDYASSLHNRRSQTRAKVTISLKGANQEDIEAALTAAAYVPDLQFQLIHSATPEELIIIRTFLRTAPSAIRERWEELHPRLCAE